MMCQFSPRSASTDACLSAGGTSWILLCGTERILEFTVIQPIRLEASFSFSFLAQCPLPEQVEPSTGLSSNFELMSSKDVACHMTSYDWELFYCVHEVGPIIPSRQTCNGVFIFYHPFLSISSSSSITPLGGRTLRKPRWTWTCSCAGSTRSSSGWSQRSVCAHSSASVCSSSRNSSKLLPSKQTLSNRCVLSSPLLCWSEFLRVSV